MRSKKEIQLLEALEEAASLRGFDLVELEQTGSSRSSLLRVYLDKPEGLTLDDVAAANTWISEVLDALDPYKGSYTLEVSSPGIDRPLRTLSHFEKALGEEAVITLESALVSKNAPGAAPSTPASEAPLPEKAKPRLKYTGSIVAVDTQNKLISLEAEGTTYQLEFAHIKKARIKGRLDFDSRKDS